MCIEALKSKVDLSLDELNSLLDSEKDVKTYKKLLYFKFNKMGYSKIESCNLAGIPESSRYYLDGLWDKGGYNALIPNYGGGRKSKLSETQLEQLKIILNSKSSWLVDDVKKLIEDKFGIKYTYQNVRSLLMKFNIDIDNYFEIERENKKISNNIIENFDDISPEDEKEINEILGLMNDEKSIEVYQKLVYLLLRKIGFSNKIASKFINKTTVTGNNWLNAWENNGYEGLLRKKGQGRKSKLTEEEFEMLKKN